MAALARISEASGTFVLGVDHFGKAMETGTRGSSAKEARADVVMSILASKEITGKVASCRLVFRKLRSGAAGKEFPFSMRTVTVGADEDGDPMTSLVVEFGTEATSAQDQEGKQWSDGIKMLRRVLMSVVADCGTDLPAFAGGPTVRAVNSDLVRDEYCKQTPAEGDAPTKKKTRLQQYRRAIKSAQAKGLIGLREINDVQWIWLTSPELHP